MVSRVYYFDTDKTDYEKVANGGLLTFDFSIDGQGLAVLRAARGIISSKSGKAQFKLLELSRRPGPAVNGMKPYRMTLDRVAV